MTTYYQPPAPAPQFQRQQLPTQRGPLVVLVIGLVLTFLVTPLILLTLVSVKSERIVDEFAHNGTSVGYIENGSEIRVNDLGTTALLLTPSNEDAQCELSNSQHTYQMESNTRIFLGTNRDKMRGKVHSTIFTVAGVEPGTYEVQCDNLVSGSTLHVVDWTFAREVAVTAVIAVFAAGASGVVGVSMIIAGLIWMAVVAHRRNQMLQMNYMQQGPPMEY